jgi:hypothetical protein
MRAAKPHKAIAALVILQPAIVAPRFAILSASWAIVTGIINEWPLVLAGILSAISRSWKNVP